MSIYGNLIDNIEIIVYTQSNFLLNEAKKTTRNMSDKEAVRGNFDLETLKGRKFTVHIRNIMGGGRNSRSSMHSASIKIKYPKINDSEVSISIPNESNKDIKIEPPDKNTERIIKSKYKESIDFVKDNSETLNDIWNCNNTEEFNVLVDKLIKDNEKYNFKKSGKKE